MLGEECEAIIIVAITDISVERVNTMANQRFKVLVGNAGIVTFIFLNSFSTDWY